MWHLLKRHPFAVRAHFDFCLVLAYALPAPVLRPLLRPSLELDTYQGFGFIAVALVQTRELRPAWMPPRLGQKFFLSGYRIFTRYTTGEGRHLRGLQILRSDTDKAFMQLSGNLLTHYNYCLASVDVQRSQSQIGIRIQTPNAAADLEVLAHLDQTGELPPGSPFPDVTTAKQYAGPLPYTFDYEKPTHSMVLVKGMRKKWDPVPVRVEGRRNTFLERREFATCEPILANAFYLENVPYLWQRGRRELLPSITGPTSPFPVPNSSV